jgi:hypothetical protein
MRCCIAPVERGDLVVVGVGDDDRLRGVAVLDRQDEFRIRAPAAKPRDVVRAVGADRGHHERFAAQVAQGVGDVAGTAAELAPQRRHEERDVQDVQLVGQDLLREAAGDDGDGVERRDPQISAGMAAP